MPTSRAPLRCPLGITAAPCRPRRVDVRLHRRVEVFAGQFEDRRARLLARDVADEDIEAAEFLDRFFDETLTEGLVAEVARNGDALATCGLQTRSLQARPLVKGLTNEPHAVSRESRTKDSTEAEARAYLADETYYPVGMFDDTVAGNRAPVYGSICKRRSGPGRELSSPLYAIASHWRPQAPIVQLLAATFAYTRS